MEKKIENYKVEKTYNGNPVIFIINITLKDNKVSLIEGQVTIDISKGQDHSLFASRLSYDLSQNEPQMYLGLPEEYIDKVEEFIIEIIKEIEK